MTTRRAFLTACAATMAGGAPARAQAPAKLVRIGYLATGTAEGNEAFLAAFRDALRALGYVEGRNIVLDMRFAGDNAGLFPDLAASLVMGNADLLVGTCIPSARAAKNATATLPVVMSVDGDPVRAGLVASLGRPGGNVTGTSTSFESLIPKWIELLRLAVPNAQRIALLSNPDNVADPYLSARFDDAAQAVKAAPLHVEARLKRDMEKAFKDMERQRADGMVVMTQASLAGQESLIVPLAERHRVPAIYGFREYAEAGGLMSYGISYREYFRGVARYIDAVLRGRKPADLPVEQPAKIELAINARTAGSMGIALRPELVARADVML